MVEPIVAKAAGSESMVQPILDEDDHIGTCGALEIGLADIDNSPFGKPIEPEASPRRYRREDNLTPISIALTAIQRSTPARQQSLPEFSSN